MTLEIIALVGDGGFNSLFDRCVGLTQATFSWLVIEAAAPQNQQRYAQLQLRFEGQPAAQVNAADNALLITFTDLLASLIGEQIVAVILNIAMDNSNSASVSTKEIDND